MTALVFRVLATLAYSGVFSWPLGVDEIVLRAINHPKDSSVLTNSEVETALRFLKKKQRVREKDGLWAVGRHAQEDQFLQRVQQQHSVKKKWQEAQQAVELLQKNQWIEAIYVTGSLAVNTAAPDSDIDFMLITSPRRLWLTRLWVIFQSWRHGKRRSFAHEEKNSWCFNLWLTTHTLQLEPNQRSLYTAYEVCQAVCVFDRRGRVEGNFLRANAWVSLYLRGFFEAKMRLVVRSTQSKKVGKHIFQDLIAFGDWLSYAAQRFYMSPHMTREVVARDKAFFHPRSTKNLISQKLDHVLCT